MTEAQDQQQLRFGQAFAVLYRLASPARRRELLWLVLLTPAAAVAELISVASIVPLLSLLSGEASSRSLPWLSAIFTGAAERTGLPTLTLAAALFVAAALLAAVTRLALAWISQRFAFGLGHEIAVDIQRRVLSQPYAFHIGQHSSQFIAALEKVEQFLFNLLLPLIRAAGAVAIILLVGAALVRLDPVSTLIALAAVGTAYALALALVRKRLAANS
ncbi:MAG: hypothetical protein LH465_05425, partial [Sphingomonas bacterium]|nr:hypothetical protein [Sphingomonas bacterium]